MVVKTLKDYYEQMYEMFPEVPKSDIKRILNAGWKTLYMYTSSGADTVISDKSFWCYIGFLKKNPINYFRYYIKKLLIKLRILYKRKKIKWDGNYYFALNEDSYLKLVSQQKSRGRKKKYLNYGNVFIYLIFDECNLANSGLKYIFKLSYPINLGYKYYYQNLITDKAELILTREPLKFLDILVTNNNYI